MSAADIVTFRYGFARLVRLLLFILGCLLMGWWLLQGELTPWDRILVWVMLALAVAAIFVVLTSMVTRKPVVEVRPEGLLIPKLGNELLPWTSLSGLWLEVKKRRILILIPVTTRDLVLDIPPDQPFWQSGGARRKLMKKLSDLADSHTISVNLNGMRQRPENILEAVRKVRPDLVRETKQL